MLCAVTFTRDAADELKERIAHSSSNLEHRLIVGTFHSVALSQLKNYYSSKLPKLLSEGQRLAVLKRCWKQHAPDLNFDEDVLPEIEAAKATLKLYEFEPPLVKLIYDSFISVMKSENSMDFSDILIMTVKLLHNGNISPLPIKWLLVDEGQDMDEVQQEWILIHGLSGIEVTLVGDDDQSLYAFRNALGYAGLQEITFRLNATQSTLPINYRCAPNILFHAAKLIAQNSNRAPKQIATMMGRTLFLTQ
jgi:superfamily I DNA/RNA helicase